jgi:pimeloyl-ACP methyl ester carboxylesterase
MTPAETRARWLLERLVAAAEGGEPPHAAALHEQFTEEWLVEVPVSRTFLEIAPLVAGLVAVREEAAAANEITFLLEAGGGHMMRMRCAVEAAAPHRVEFVVFSAALPPSSYVDRVVRRGDDSVRIRDFGGEGPLMLLWHGAGCDVTIWEAIVPWLPGFRVVAQDLPGHGRSSHPHLSVAETLADGRAVLAELGGEEPIVVGHSIGGWIALHHAATAPCRALVCLDGPSNIEYAAMGLRREHPGWLPDPPDVRADLDAISCPALFTLSSGASADVRESMVSFRRGLAADLASRHPEVRLEWQPTGHMNVLSQARETGELIQTFTRDAVC